MSTKPRAPRPAEPEGQAPLPPFAHPCLAVETAEALPQAAVRLTGRQRLGIVLQGAGLISHLDHSGWHLADAWSDAGLSREGTLRAAAAPGRPLRQPQEVLRELLALLFGDGATGPGEARSAARALASRWRQDLAPVPPDQAVAEILELAPFLWEAPFAAARRALAAEHRSPSGSHLWVAGPGPFRSRLLARCADHPSLESLLAGPHARPLWDGEPASGSGPAAGAAIGRADDPADPITAAAVGLAPAERLELAYRLFSRGRFARALATVSGMRSRPAAILALACQHQLGALGAARGILRRLSAADLSAREVVEVAEVAVLVFTNAGDAGRAAGWVRRALAAAGAGPLAPRAALVAAGAAWDERDTAALESHLEAARPALASADLAWRWHQVEGLLARQRGDGAAMIAALTRALGAGRRRLFCHQAAGLWNDLGLGRAQAGDLPGAERAFRHSARLMAGGEGPRRATLALSNLAEIRLRRGHTAGVRDILAQAQAENRRAGNRRGLAEDAELEARFALVEGRPAAALDLCRAALAESERHGLEWDRAQLHTLAARALGWLGRAPEAAAELVLAMPDGPPAVLEPEERPALWALAGDRAEARRQAEIDSGPAELLWRSVLAESRMPTPVAAWDALESLEPYRAARLVLDLELVAPGTVPAERRSAAAAVLRRLGAVELAARLENTEPREPWMAGKAWKDTSAWRALAAHLERTAGGLDPAAWGDLFAAAGAAGAEITLEGDERRTLLAGPGGEQELTLDCAAGRLVLRHPAKAGEEPWALRALLALLARELSAPAPSATAATARRPLLNPLVPIVPPGIVGESPQLLAAVARALRLAAEPLTVLVLGESGTGKELIARLIHRASPRARGAFVAVNCAALSDTLILSDLFGHVRGAFTGADRERAGVFETADGGTVFLDEIGDLPPAAQGLLLRALQEGEIRRLGESLPRKIDVRVVAATHRDLARRVEEGLFRRDLFYRLKVGSVELPPLRERGDDVLLLAERALARAAQRSGGAPLELTRAARLRLAAHPWPGNVRELENVLAVAVALAGNGPIEPEHLDLPAQTPSGITAERTYHAEVDALRRRLVADALASCGGNGAEAARRLGLSRQALSYLVRQLDLL